MNVARVGYDMMVRIVLALGLLLVPTIALAAPSPAPSAPGASEAHDGGVIRGVVTAVDYQRSVLGIDAPGRGKMEVQVMPSTSFQGTDNGYHSIVDVRAGQRVEIFSSIAGGKYVAQIVRMRP